MFLTVTTSSPLEYIRKNRYKREYTELTMTARALTPSEQDTSLMAIPSLYKDGTETPEKCTKYSKQKKNNDCIKRKKHSEKIRKLCVSIFCFEYSKLETLYVSDLEFHRGGYTFHT